MTERNGNTLVGTVTTVLTVPAGTRIAIGGTVVTLAQAAVVETTPLCAEHVRVEIEYQQAPRRMSDR
jgi:hypothetical protein